ncbi:MAG: AbrB/MazE/SpoVT family DNA-binding domain-containing protein [Egibacteraceae bacterium]
MAEGMFVSVQGRGVIALPAELRRRFGLDRPGAQVEVVAREDGVIELRPHLAVPAEQAWVWTPQWQERIQEGLDDLQADRSESFESGQALLHALEARSEH